MEQSIDDTRFKIVQRIRHLPDTRSRLATAHALAEAISLNDPSEPNYRLLADILEMLFEEDEVKLAERL